MSEPDTRSPDAQPKAGEEHRSEGSRAPGEPRSTRVRHVVGLVGGVLGALVVYAIMPGDLDVWIRLTAATAVLMAAWWMTEAIPIPATALLPLIIFPLLVPAGETEDGAGVTVDTVGANYGNNIIFLFMGGFMLALAMQRWNLHCPSASPCSSS